MITDITLLSLLRLPSLNESRYLFHPYPRTRAVVTGSSFSYRPTSKLSKLVPCLSLSSGERCFPPMGDLLKLLEMVQNSNRKNKYKRTSKDPEGLHRVF